MDDGIVYIKSTFNDGKNSRFTYQPDKEKQKLYARNREFEKFLAWKKAGLKNFKNLMSDNLYLKLTE